MSLCKDKEIRLDFFALIRASLKREANARDSAADIVLSIDFRSLRFYSRIEYLSVRSVATLKGLGHFLGVAAAVHRCQI